MTPYNLPCEYPKPCQCPTGVDGIRSLPTQEECGWEGHDRAVQEAGYCPVCQH